MSWFPRFYNREADNAVLPHTVDLGPVTFAPLPLEAGRNDIYQQGYTYPKGNSDRWKWYNNTYWGNRLPDYGNGIGIPGYSAVHQKVFWTQYSPEQKGIQKYQLTGGPYPYGMSVNQSANILQKMSAAWRAATTGG